MSLVLSDKVFKNLKRERPTFLCTFCSRHWRSPTPEKSLFKHLVEFHGLTRKRTTSIVQKSYPDFSLIGYNLAIKDRYVNPAKEFRMWCKFCWKFETTDCKFLGEAKEHFWCNDQETQEDLDKRFVEKEME